MFLNETGISIDDIERVIGIFYRDIRDDPTLGPVFAKHVDNWPEHEKLITDFWSNAMLRSGAYVGNPMRKHLAAQDVMPAHFTTWLDLFDAVLTRTLPASKAVAWSNLTRRIGRGLCLGIQDRNRPKGAVPAL
ncbi:MAG: group III truncated hemoglobin [Planktomarina sp.]